MDIRFLGAHNIETRTTKFVCLLINETIAIDAGGLTSGLSSSEQLKIKAVMLTHTHYDHIRDIPSLALSLFLNGASFDVYCTTDVGATIKTHLLNGKLYPKLHELPEAKPTINLNHITPFDSRNIDDCEITAVKVNHTEDTVGYRVRDNEGKIIFYTSDTGPGLSGCWQHLSPQLVIIDVTTPNRFEEYARQAKHLTPRLLQKELIEFRVQKGYLPRIIVVHMNPALEEEIKEEISTVAEDLNTSITVAYEDMQVRI
jgi:phosphoribosyl 1,2-cyclic phosphodiesterase